MNEVEAAAIVVELVPYLNRVIAADARRTLRDGWFTLVHTRVMAHIRRTGGCSLGDLAEQRGVSLPTMSKMISSLVDKGIVTRETDPTNRRAVIIRATAEGERLYLEVIGQLQRHLADDLRQLSAEQRESIVSTLELLSSVMSNAGEIRQHFPPLIGDEQG